MRFHPAPPIIAHEPAQLSAVFFLLISPAASFTPTLSLSLSAQRWFNQIQLSAASSGERQPLWIAPAFRKEEEKEFCRVTTLKFNSKFFSSSLQGLFIYPKIYKIFRE